VSGKFTLTLDELRSKYRDYLLTKDRDYRLYCGHYSLLCLFIGAEDGLSSTTDPEVIQTITPLLKEVWATL